MDKNIKAKISDNTHSKDSEVSKFSVSYSARKIDNSQVSYEIISALKDDDDIIIEVNSSLLNLSQNDSRNLISKLVDSLERMNIDYKNKRISVNARRAIFSIGMDNKKVEGFEFYAFIPRGVWCDQEFRKIIPKVGVRYYLLKSSSENNLDAFANLNEDEKFELCRMVIFDNILFGSMGINTSIFKKDDIIEMLNK
ncbi:MAG TPA: hypothetical protein VIK78_10920 [Ruminiclostridium sp.]